MYSKKTIYFFCRISLLVMFLFVTMKSSIFVLSSTLSDNDELRRENVVEIAGENSCSVDGSCCCGPANHNKSDCSCNSKTLGKGSIKLAVKTSESKFLDAVISSIKCSGTPGDFQIGSLSDYEPYSLHVFLSLLEEAGFQPYLQEDHIVEPHLFLPYKPPRNIS